MKNLLFSQIGYDTGRPVRIVHRSFETPPVHPDHLELSRAPGGKALRGIPLVAWGERWGSHWAVAQLPDLEPGRYRLRSGDGQSVEFVIGKDLLWEETFEWVGLRQGEVRQRFCRVKPGWRDCGSWLQEANSHAVYLWGLMDVLEHAVHRLTDDQRERLPAQIRNGLDCLAAYQDAAQEAGLGVGALIHDISSHKDTVIRNDVIKAALAFARAGRLLDDGPQAGWTRRAEKAFRWAKDADPFAPKTLEPRAHGAPGGYKLRGKAWQTCDLFLMASVALELARSDRAFEKDAREFLDAGLGRQVPETEAEGRFFGHFYAFDDKAFTEKVWTHHGISYDTGQTFAHWLFPVMEALRRRPDDPEAPHWRGALEDFAKGYLLPGCEANPFRICPLGVYGDEGLLDFAGLWHGMNTVYGYTAALARELMQVFPDLADRLEAVATGNLQWVAGLNAGVTRVGLCGSHMFTMKIPEDQALPASMIYGIGRRWAGSWTTVPGSITNGFSVGDQFRFDTEPTRANDGPHAFNDEEWITHAGAWLAAISRE